MRREGAIRLSFCGLFLVVCMSMGAGAWAQENMCIVPTGSGQALNQLPSALTIIAGADEISPAQPVSLRAAWGCFPFEYTWQVQGTGYSLSKATTNGDLDHTILTVAGGTCGVQYSAYATITVWDSCDNTETIAVRNEVGTWGQPLYEWYVRCQCTGSECQSCWSWSYCQSTAPGCNLHWNDMTEDVVGHRRWITTHWHCNCAAGCGGSSTIMRWCGAPDGSIYEVPGTNGLVKDEYCPPGCPSPFDCQIGAQDCSQPWYPEIRTWCIPDVARYYEWRCQ
jgi:hypothetical protein